MNEKVPFIWHEMKIAKMEHKIKTLRVWALVLFTAFAASNIGWILHFFWLR